MKLDFRVPIYNRDGSFKEFCWSYDPTQWGQHWVDKAWSIARDGGKVNLYTGLHDKNGEKIYEDDIISYHGYGTFVIRFCKGCFSLGTGDLLYSYPSKYIKVIGNIHENPELLEKE